MSLYRARVTGPLLWPYAYESEPVLEAAQHAMQPCQAQPCPAVPPTQRVLPAAVPGVQVGWGE